MFFAPVAILLLGKPTPSSFLYGLPFVVIGESIRLWASGYLVKMADVITAGPFALCRNPLYWGSFFICIGYLIMCQNLKILVLGILLFWLFHIGAVFYEEKLLKERFGEQYDSYCKTVPRFLPHLRRLSGNGSFSFKQLVCNDEYRSASSALIFVVAFGLRAYLELI